jgi:hypothetical protein
MLLSLEEEKTFMWLAEAWCGFQKPVSTLDNQARVPSKALSSLQNEGKAPASPVRMVTSVCKVKLNACKNSIFQNVLLHLLGHTL